MILNRKPLKYISVIVSFAALFYVASASSTPAVDKTSPAQLPDSIPNVVPDVPDSLDRLAPPVIDSLARKRVWLNQLQDLLPVYKNLLARPEDSLGTRARQLAGIEAEAAAPLDSLGRYNITLPPPSDSLGVEEDFARRIGEMLALQNQTPQQDTVPQPRPARRPFLDQVMTGSNQDSLIYQVRNKKVYIYRKGEVDYGNMNIQSDFMRLNTETKEIFAYGLPDSLGKAERTKFTQDGQAYEMDSMLYNINTQRGNIWHVTTKQGDGFLIGNKIKKQADNTFSAAGGRYTTCDHIDHPHFFIEMNRAKFIPDKKVIMGRTHFVMEDVPIVFPFIPFGFFPLTTGRSSGLIVPTFGEEYVKGFFLRDAGYYFAINDYVDVRATASIWTLGSWNAGVASRYLKRYSYSGSFNLRYSADVLGERGSKDFRSGHNYSIGWTHSQDARFRPNSSFSASVNYASSGYSKNSSTNINDYLNTQINSSIAYSKSWPGKPYSFSTSFNHSQNTRDSIVSFTFPNASFNVSRINPFKSKLGQGSKWYEKITVSYAGRVQGSARAHERDLFTSQTLRNMRSGVSHSIPVSVSWSLLNYINFTPSVNYNERWYFQKIEQQWDPSQNAIARDTTYGFYRVFDYNANASLNTTWYGMYQFKGENPIVRAIRHVLTPSISIGYTPNFGDPRYGFFKTVQTDSTGTLRTYSPFESGIFGVPGSRESASLSFSLRQNLEAKIRSERDTTGWRKIKVIDDFNLGGSYDLLADSMNLSMISFSLRTPIVKNYILQITGSFDPYQVNENGTRINRFLLKKGKLARLASANTSFSYTFNSSTSARPAMNDISSGGAIPPPVQGGFFDDQNQQALDPEARRRMMTSQYYDFNVPWNFGISYGLTYTNNGRLTNITQTLSFQGSITPTDKWGINFSGGYDFRMRKMSFGTVSINRDLHCWQMSLQWIPLGSMRGWGFNIRVKSNILKDLKYDKNSSRYDNLFD